MVKYIQRKEDCEVSTSHSIYSESDILPSETLSNIIDKMPKLTVQERKQTCRLYQYSNYNSKKWSQTQTKQFYELLRHFGLDFTLMSYHPFFSKRRSQKQLSNKYKKELKMNQSCVEQVLNKIELQGLYSIYKSREEK